MAKKTKARKSSRKRSTSKRQRTEPVMDYLSKLDPSLMLGALRAPKERPRRAARKKLAAPASVADISAGICALRSQMSDNAARRFLTKDLVPVLVETSDPADLARTIDGWKGSCREVSRNTAVARVPRNRLRDLAGLGTVNYVEASAKLRPKCDLAHQSSGLVAGQTRAVPQTGAGVLVGIIDTGIDVDHASFKRAGKTRIVNYLDQERGRQYDAADIDAGSAAQSPDEHGHGTHVAGIAAGNGAGSPQRRLQGVAPDADLAIVKTTMETADLVVAIQHIFDLAASRSQSCVINLSLGGHAGGHDGSTIVERTIDQLSGPGRIVVVAAGNEGNDPIHASTVMEPGGADPARWVADFAVNARVFDLPEGQQVLGVVFVQVWHQREDQIQVTLRSPNGELFSPPQQGEQEFDRGTFLVQCSHQNNPYSGDHVTSFFVITVPQEDLLSGWSVIATEDRQAGGIAVGAVHAWIPDMEQGHFTSEVTRSHLVGMPATAHSAVTVAAYATRKEWESKDPGFSGDAINLEEISYFSSMGPTRDGQNKPEIAAPGQWLLAPLSSAAAGLPLFVRVKNMPYVALQGTSMATPYVTGALALLLEKHPDLDWAEAKRRLIKSAHQDNRTRVCWNARWGYGKLDVARLLTLEPD